MLMISNIKENIDIEYCAFLDEDGGAFNLVSTINNEAGFNLLEGESCLIRISSKGFLQELEVIFSNHSKTEYNTFTYSEKISGVPVINPNDFIKSKEEPVIIKYKEGSLILFGQTKAKKCDICLVGSGIKYYILKNEVIAIEVSELIQDYGGTKQIQWLEKRKIL
jgi:hypothetical protein